MNSSATNKPIITKFHLECYLGGEKVALGFGLYLVFYGKRKHPYGHNGETSVATPAGSF